MMESAAGMESKQVHTTADGTRARSDARVDRHRQADDVLKGLLDRPNYGPGARLPTERALAQSLNLPRSTVRAAFTRLEARGLVRRVIGSGTFVTDADPDATERASAQDASPQVIMQARLLIEPELAALVVANANAADLKRIGDIARNAESVEDFEDFETFDGLFHQAIADATHNRLMAELYRTITITRERAVWGELKRRSLTAERRRRYQEQHRAILMAFARRDAQEAETALRDHLVEVRKNLFGY